MSIKKISNYDSRSISILFYKFEKNSLYIFLQKNNSQYKDIGGILDRTDTFNSFLIRNLQNLNINIDYINNNVNKFEYNYNNKKKNILFFIKYSDISFNENSYIWISLNTIINDNLIRFRLHERISNDYILNKLKIINNKNLNKIKII